MTTSPRLMARSNPYTSMVSSINAFALALVFPLRAATIAALASERVSASGLMVSERPDMRPMMGTCLGGAKSSLRIVDKKYGENYDQFNKNHDTD